MHDTKRIIGVLLGGSSSERDISLRSGAALTQAYQRLGRSVVSLDTQSGRDLPRALMDHGIEVAVIALHGPLGEDGSVQGLLEVMGIPYSGSSVTASALCMDKALCKRLLRDAGIATPAWEERRITLGQAGQPTPAEDLAVTPAAEGGISLREGPWFVKPTCAGSSVGIHCVEKRSGVDPAVSMAAASAGQPGDIVSVLVEQAVVGTEVTLTILEGEPLPLIEIRPEEGFYDYRNKYTPGRTQYLIPAASLSAQEIQKATRTGLHAGRVLGCRGLYRVDMIVDRQGGIWVLEINTVPGLTETSLAPQAAKAAGMTFDLLAERILAGASLAGRSG